MVLITPRSTALSRRALQNIVRSSSVSFVQRALSATTAASSPVHMPDRPTWQAKGFMDDRGLTVFGTLHEMIDRSCQVFGPRNLFGTYSETSKSFEWINFQEFADKVDSCRSVLRDLGVQQYDKVAIISNNRWEWAAIAAAAYSINANPVPMYEAQLPSDWTYIINDSEAKVLFCSNTEIYNRVAREVKSNTPLLQSVLVFDGEEGDAFSLAKAMASVKADVNDEYVVPPTPDDLANLIYTSGTTGKPKGVELTHLNFTSNVKAAARSMMTDPHDLIRPGDVSLAFLPWAHSYGQTCELWVGISHGAGMGICRGVPMILEDLSIVKPNYLFAVPTLYKKIYDGVHNMMESASPIRKRLMKTALDLGRRNVEAQNGNAPPLGFFENMQYKALDKLVLSKIRARFGGNLRTGFVAGAACPSEVLDFMDSIGIPVCEGYGLTETSPIICINTPEQRKVGSVGRPIGEVEVYIVDEEGKRVASGEEGEICCVGPNVMRGYYKNPEATNEVITTAPDGKSRMFHTGDLGRMDQDRWVRVTGRLKEQYKLENGKYVVPTPIEEAIGMSRFITQVVLCGANRPFNVVLIVPELVAIRKGLKISDSVSDSDMVNDPRVHALIDKEIQSGCRHLKKFEVPQAWTFVAPFTAANGMMTPKMSIRRHKVIQAYGDEISRMYGDDPVVAEASDSAGAKESAAA
ncbi:hypothetical protein ACA910_006060 [Epithemia clementina (nom. ined.)]